MKAPMLVLLMLASSADARMPGPPPDEAFSACAGQPQQQDCQFQDPQRGETIGGQCQSIENIMVCVPAHPQNQLHGRDSQATPYAQPEQNGQNPYMQRPYSQQQGDDQGGNPYPQGQSQQMPRGRRPPPEALSACNGQSASSRCEFESPHGTISGQCTDTPSGMACVPEHPPGGIR